MNHTCLGVLLAATLATIPAAATASPRTSASDPQQLEIYELVLADGSRLFGNVERETDTDIVFRTVAGGVITVQRREVASLRPATGTVRNGEFLREDRNATRLFFGPTGRTLPKGQAYLGVYEFLLPFIQVGVTDRFSFGGGTPLVFPDGGWDRPFWLTPKLEVYKGAATDVSVGAFMGFGGGGSGGIAYGVLTRGTPDASFTAGAGVAYSSDGGRAPVVMVGADRRIARNLKVMTENYVWEGRKGMTSLGVRFIGERLSADLAFAIPMGTDSFVAFPLVNFVYVF